MTQEMVIKVRDVNLFAKLVGEHQGKPTVIMDAGYGDDSSVWKSMIMEVAAFANVLIYDRAGLGKSGKSSNERTSLEMVKELNELLHQMNLDPPYLLVGHSFGGVNMRLYATEYPEEVYGLVLVDATPEDYRERFLPTMSQEFQQAYAKQFTREGNYEEVIKSLKQLKETKQRIHIPLLVLSAGKKAYYTKSAQELWNDMQKEMATLSSKGEFILAENSAHYIQNDEPEVVVNAIKRLIEGIN
ncbi:alpha/beta hydrolase [Alkalihalophilus lindianensis]|uniref:Alpha/beta hydrolase n=1 Tax=Alkalihalophilus lindianensis TaxID=1630542 RepID=A0ABU3X4Z6_9BACI|nr:alpha/beta hydrolase [Alkalihalophilus lindianensis]MDV2682858.1 alpha/beta hydrolase [Alkalihalophilus lindianensis]